MVTKEEVERVIRETVDEKFVKSVEVDGGEGNVRVTLAKDTPQHRRRAHKAPFGDRETRRGGRHDNHRP